LPRTFKMIQKLGEGAFGAVHLAEVSSSDGLVQTLAIKWLHSHLSTDSELARRLRDEARLLALLRHESIVRVHGLTRIEGRLAILMEPIDGVDLSRLEESTPPRAALEIIEAVADALNAASQTIPHGQEEPLGVVHRDIKPSNIMVTSRGGVKVMDFGVARATFDNREAHTQSQQFGTARYMAPERWLHGVAGVPSDVFSLGITLIEIVSGHPVERVRLSESAFEADLDEALGHLDQWPEIAELTRQMCAFLPDDRPSPADVALQCGGLSEKMLSSSLKQWAAEWVGAQQAKLPRPSGNLTEVTEDASAETYAVSPPSFDTYALPLPTAAEPKRRRIRLYSILGPLIVAGGTAAILTINFWPLTTTTPLPILTDTPSATNPAPELEIPRPAEPKEPTTKVEAAKEDEPKAKPDTPTRPKPVEPEPEPEPPTTTVTFILEPPDLVVTTPLGKVRHRTAMVIPQNELVLVTVGSGPEAAKCNLPIEAVATTWHITTEGCKHVR
jgi:serine/threonine protein kinase